MTSLAIFQKVEIHQTLACTASVTPLSKSIKQLNATFFSYMIHFQHPYANEISTETLKIRSPGKHLYATYVA